ncbi:MAG: tellurium resistance protein TerC [Frankiales bacterium]|nr:tellurium resistance protein TerC [Frankiales bacterium]
MLEVHLYTWVLTIGAFIAILGIDLLIAARKGPHVISVGEATKWIVFYVALAVAFGIGLAVVAGGQSSGEFFAGYLTEYSLSVDNLFVFVIIMASFAVPQEHQHKVLLFGIVLALVLRGAFIAVGAAVIEAFSGIFFVFGAFLIYTAIQLARHRDEEPEVGSNPLMKLMERVMPTTREYDGAKVTTKIDGKRVATPLLLVMVAIGSTDILFALDSIPAIFGLTKEPYIVFTANAFALLGLRQLYFLLDGLLDRLVYLSIGLAVILGFIGIKLILEAAHLNISKSVPEIGIPLSLGFIVTVLVITTVASLRKTKRDPSAIKKHTPSPGADKERIPEDQAASRPE